LPSREDRDYLIVHAEIYPSLVPNLPTEGSVKDAVQVKTTATHFAALDDAGELSSLFAGPTWLTTDERERVESEEGWTLGVLAGRQVHPRLNLQRRTAAATGSLACDRTRIDRSAPSRVDVGSAGELPACDFVYFATPACGSWTITAEFVDSARAIIAHAYNTIGLRMPLIQQLRPGHQILLVYGAAGRYTPVFRCRVCTSSERVRTRKHTFDVFCYIAEEFHDRLRDEGYESDPVIQRFTGMAIDSVQDLRDNKTIITKPKGNNTLRRWDEVFSGTAEREST
jgi:hypothetical protein